MQATNVFRFRPRTGRRFVGMRHAVALVVLALPLAACESAPEAIHPDQVVARHERPVPTRRARTTPAPTTPPPAPTTPSGQATKFISWKIEVVLPDHETRTYAPANGSDYAALPTGLALWKCGQRLRVVPSSVGMEFEEVDIQCVDDRTVINFSAACARTQTAENEISVVGLIERGPGNRTAVLKASCKNY